MSVARLVVTLVGALAAAPCLAQDRPPAAACEGLPAPAAIRQYDVRLAARAVKEGRVVGRPSSGRERERLVMLLQSAGSALQFPESLRFVHGPATAYTPASDSGRSKAEARKEPRLRPDVHARVQLVLRAAGPVSEATVTPSSFPELDSALVRMVRTAGDRDAFAGLLAPGEAAGDSAEVALELVVEDTVGVTAPVAKISIPHYAGTPVRWIANPQGGPRYPQTMREQNREGEVLLQFVVTEEGRVDLMSVRRLRLTGSPDFERAVMAWLPFSRFDPAKAGGCPVRMVVQAPFQFALRREWFGRDPHGPGRPGRP